MSQPSSKIIDQSRTDKLEIAMILERHQPKKFGTTKNYLTESLTTLISLAYEAGLHDTCRFERATQSKSLQSGDDAKRVRLYLLYLQHVR